MTHYLGFWYFWVVFLGLFGFFFEFSKSFLEYTQKVRQGLFSSFWSYEPPFRQEGGEGEGVKDRQTDERTDGRTVFPLLDSDQLLLLLTLKLFLINILLIPFLLGMTFDGFE